jgi:hypothetical protein
VKQYVALASSQWRFTGFQPVHALEAHEYAIGKDADATLKRSQIAAAPVSRGAVFVVVVACD